MCGKSLRPRREALERVRGHTERSDAAQGAVPVAIRQTETPHHSWGIAWNALKCFLSVVGDSLLYTENSGPTK